MSPKYLVPRLVFFLSGVRLIRMIVCTTKNITCTTAKDNAGHYQFHFETPRATEAIEIDEGETPLVRGPFGKLSLAPDVVHCDDKSIIRRMCGNISVKFIQGQGDTISESCLDFNVIDDLISSFDWIPIIIGVTILVVLVVVFFCYWLCSRNRERNGCGLPVCVFNRGGNFCPQGRHEGQRVAEVENRENSLREEKYLLDGKSDKSNGSTMDVSINMEGISTTNKDEGAPQVNGALPHDSENGNLRHDPGGGKADTGLHGTEICRNGRTLGEQSPKCDIDKEQHSPRTQGSARPGSDETDGGQGQTLVHSRGPNSDHTSLPEGLTLK